MLLLFVDPGCGPCAALLHEAARWEREHAEAFSLLVVSRGTPKENRKKVAGDHGFRHVLLQEKYEVSERYSTVGTPSAVLVRANGRIGSAVASGTEAIKGLVARTLAPAGETTMRLGRGASEEERGVPVGAAAPPIKLSDLKGRTVELVRFRGHDTLVLFWNPGCGFCQRMLDDLKSWEAAEAVGKPRLLVVSTGTPEANRAMGLRAPLVLDQGFTVGRSFGAGGTPSAVLVDAEGRIASQVAVGAQAVLSIAAPISRSGVHD